MKYSAIEDMYYARKGSFNNAKLSKEMLEQIDKVLACDKKMKELLEGEPDFLEVFEEYQEAVEGQLGIAVRDAFKQGFRFGALMGMDILEED